MSMTRKDYNAIAEAINKTFHRLDMAPKTNRLCAELVAEIGDSIQLAGNTNFDRYKFIQAAFRGL